MMDDVLRLAGVCALVALAGCAVEGIDDFNEGDARAVIAAGGVPRPQQIDVDAVLAAHQFPTPLASCDAPLCLEPELAVAQNLASGRIEYWMHVTTAARPLPRPPRDLVVVIDKSATMAVDLAATVEAVVALLDRIEADDRLAILAFDDQVHELHPLDYVVNPSALAAKVRTLAAGGGWSLQSATARAYNLLAQADKPGRLRRVVLLAGSNPLIAADHGDHFSQMVLQHGAAGVGMSYYGVLLGYDSRVAELLAVAPGGAYQHVAHLEQVARMFDIDLGAAFTPVAYDLALSVDSADGVSVSAMYGGERSASTTTAFLVDRPRHLVANLSPAERAPMARDVGRVALSYVPEPALGWADAVLQQVVVRAPAGQTPFFETPGVRKAVALINLGQQLRAACAAYHAGDRPGARRIVAELREYFSGHVEALDDPTLADELAMVDALAANLN